MKHATRLARLETLLDRIAPLPDPVDLAREDHLQIMGTRLIAIKRAALSLLPEDEALAFGQQFLPPDGNRFNIVRDTPADHYQRMLNCLRRGHSIIPHGVTGEVWLSILKALAHEDCDDNFLICDGCKLARPHRQPKHPTLTELCQDYAGKWKGYQRPPDFFSACPHCGCEQWTWATWFPGPEWVVPLENAA